MFCSIIFYVLFLLFLICLIVLYPLDGQIVLKKVDKMGVAGYLALESHLIDPP